MLLSVAILLAIGTTKVLIDRLPLGIFRSLFLLASGILFTYFYIIAEYRLFLYVIPLREGEIVENSKEETRYHIYLLFYLIFFYPLMRSGFLPLPLMRLIYIALGARLGKNTYSSGIILDPPFVEVGANTLIGQYALFIPHVIEGKRLAHYRIKIGNNVTIGAHAVVMSGVTIGDNAIVGVGAVVPKGITIGSYEVWGGIPAKKIKNVENSSVH